MNLAWSETDLKEIIKQAESGDFYAQNKLGMMYYEGHGVPSNAIKAYIWWSLASDNEFEISKENLEILRHQMTPLQIALTGNEASKFRKQINNSKK